MGHAFLQGIRPRVFGHRGAAGLAPENTLPSFALGLELGADILELDVHGTRDGEIVVFHDPTLERTTNGEGLVRERSLAQLRELDAGYHFSRDGRDFPYRGQGVRVTTFEELLRRFPGARCNVEVKQGEPAIAADVVNLIRRMGAVDRVLLAAEHGDIMDDIRRHGTEIATSFSTTDAIDFFGRVQRGDLGDYHPPGCALQIPARIGDTILASTETIAAAHALGLEMHIWTINQADEMEDLLRLGVDGIISDLPGLARCVCEAYLSGGKTTQGTPRTAGTVG